MKRVMRSVAVLLLVGACDAAATPAPTPASAPEPAAAPAPEPVPPAPAVAAATPPPPSAPVGPSAFDRVLDASARGTASLLEPPADLGDDASRAARDVVDASKGFFTTPSTPSPVEPTTPTPKAAPKSPKPVAPKTEPDPKPDPEPPKPDPEPPKPEPEPSKPNPSGRNLAKAVGDRIEMKGAMQFEFGSAKLTAGTSDLLDDVALAMLASGKSYCIEGHSASTGSDSFNLKLTAKRASSVRKALILRTVPESRLQAKGFGETCLIADEATEEGRAKNSRIEIATTCACK